MRKRRKALVPLNADTKKGHPHMHRQVTYVDGGNTCIAEELTVRTAMLSQQKIEI